MMKKGSLLIAFFLMSACEPSMNHEAKVKPYTLRFSEVEGTVDRSRPIGTPPFTMANLKRGESRFQIYCAPCHAEDAQGHGMIVQHGFLNPPSLHRDDLRAKPAQFFVDVITNGYGAMYSYADRLPMEDRWDVAYYIQALQISQHFDYQKLSAEEKSNITENPDAKAGEK